MRAAWMLGLVLAGCGTKDGTTDDTDVVDTDDSDVVLDTDTDVEDTEPVDTEVIDTDDTDPVETDTDLPPLRFFFTADDVWSGSLGDPSGADLKCQYDATKPTAGTYKALLVGGGRVACTNANCAAGTDGRSDWVLQPNRTYVGEGGATFTTDALALIVFPMPAPLAAPLNFWSGLDKDWTNDELDCGGWGQDDPGVNGRVGWSDDVDADVLDGGQLNCGTTAALLCVEQ